MRLQGAQIHSLKLRKKDLYETPACATRALIENAHLPPKVWEPCADRRAIMRELQHSAIRVITYDLKHYPGADPGIETPVDFFDVTGAPRGVDTIVTNPPFYCADDFIRRGLLLVPTVIVLLRLMAIEGIGRSDLIDRHLRTVHAGIERLPMMHRHGYRGRKIKGAGAPFGWFVFHAEPRRRGSGFKVHRMSWGDRT